MSADRVRWEHIQRVFYQNDCNVSETARRLRMHRRTLQRILSKHAHAIPVRQTIKANGQRKKDYILPALAGRIVFLRSRRRN